MRDIFDLAAIIEADREKLSSFLHLVAERLDKAIDRIDALLDRYEEMAHRRLSNGERTEIRNESRR